MGMKKSVFFVALYLGFLTSISVFARDVKRVDIEKHGLSDDPANPPSSECKEFKPTVDQVKSYFSKAYPVDSYLSAQTFYSPCYAKGTLEYADGNRGTWTLKSSGIARIHWERSGWVVLYYGHNQWYDPFDDTYDENGV